MTRRLAVPPTFATLEKRGGGSRVLVDLDESDRLAFDAAVWRVAEKVERALGREVVATRASSRPGVLLSWKPARARWLAQTRRAMADSNRPIALATDIRECFASASTSAVSSSLRRLGADRDETSEIEGWLDDLQDHGVRGLPVGPAGSMVLANSVLTRIDDALRASGIAFMRWVDDIVTFNADEEQASATLETIAMAAWSTGLTLNAKKTRLLRVGDEERGPGGILSMGLSAQESYAVA